MAAVMSQLNSSRRPSMAFMPPLRALLAAYGDDGAALTRQRWASSEVPLRRAAVGVEAVNRARLERGRIRVIWPEGDNQSSLPQARPAESSGSAPAPGPAEPRACKSSRTAGRGPRPHLSWKSETTPRGRPPSGENAYSPRAFGWFLQFNRCSDLLDEIWGIGSPKAFRLWNDAGEPSKIVK